MPRVSWLGKTSELLRRSTAQLGESNLWGLLAAVLALAALGGYAFDRHQRAQLRQEAAEYLGAVSSLKVREIEAWLGERIGDAIIAGRALAFARAVEAQLAQQSSAEIEGAALAQAHALRKTYRYSEVFLLAEDGRLLLGTDPDPQSLTEPTRAALRAALEARAPRFSDFSIPRPGAAPLLDLAAPVWGLGRDSGRIVGAVVLRIDPQQMFWPLLAAWPDVTHDGRLALLRQDGAGWTVFDVTGAAAGELMGPHRVVPSADSVYAQVAQGSGIGSGSDELGRSVLAAANGVGAWPWTLVATIPLANLDTRVGPATLLAMGWIVVVLGSTALLAHGYARRRADDVVRASEERLRISQALAHAGSWEWRPRSNAFAISDELSRILGLPSEAAPSPRRWLRRVPAAGRRALIAALRTTLRDGKRASLEHDVRRSDGQVRIVQHEANRYAAAIGLEPRIVGVVLDVTERRLAERALRESEAALENVFEHMQDAFVRVEFAGSGRVLEANPAAVRMLGWDKASDLIGKSMIEEIVVDPEDSRALRRKLSSAGVAHHQRATLRRRDGSHVLTEANLRLIHNAAGEPQALEGVVRDVSLHYQRQAQLIAAREAALEAAQVKSRFLANVSHEIRTPLNAIVGLSHLLALADLPARERDQVQKIQASARSLLDLINDVLDFSKLEAGKLQLDRAPFQLDEVLDAVANVVAVEAQQKRLELSFSVPEAVPIALVGDAARLRQVLTNLTHNAVKFTSAGEVVVGVELLERGASQARLRFSVRDTGIGIRAEDLSKLFAVFTQADDSTTRRFGGTGLGLAISAEFVQLMGGRIDVQSAPGVGSTFSFVLELPLGTRQRPPALPASLVRARVLLADAHTASLLLLGRYLRELGFALESASSCPEALRMLGAAEREGHPFDLLLLDWRLPGVSGSDSVRRIKSELRTPPRVILLTAQLGATEAELAPDSGIDAYSSKPVTRSGLLDAIARARGDAVMPRNVGAAPASLSGARVLVAEDNEINQQVARQLLESAGVEVRIVANGREAVAAATDAGERYDAILMDLQMPELDGYQATRAIRAHERGAELPIIAMTAHTLELERERCREAGMNAHVAKPVDPAQLFATLAQWVRPRSLPAAPAIAEALIPGIDFEAALRRVRNNRRLLLQLLGELARTWRDGGARMRQHLARSEAETARRAAHTLKGAAANLGADGLAAAAGRVERALAGSETQAAEAAIEELEATLQAVCSALDERLPRLSA